MGRTGYSYVAAALPVAGVLLGVLYNPLMMQLGLAVMIVAGFGVLPNLWRRDEAFRRLSKGLLAIFLLPALVSLITWMIRGTETASMLSRHLEWLLVLPILSYCYRFLSERAWHFVILMIGSLILIITLAYIQGILEVSVESFNNYAYRNSNHAALLLTLFGMASVLMMLARREYLVWLIFAVATFYSSLITESRTGLITTLLLVIVMSLHLVKVGSKRVAIFLIIAITGLLITTEGTIRKRIELGIVDYQSFQSGEFNKAESIGWRLSMWQVGLELIKENPWLGYGSKSFKSHMSNAAIRGEIPNYYANPAHSHNQFIENTVSEGLFSGLSVVLLFAIPALWFLRRYLETASPYALLGILTAGAFAISSLTDVVFYFSAMRQTYALWIGLTAAMVLRQGSTGQRG